MSEAERSATYLLCDVLTTTMDEMTLAIGGCVQKDSVVSFVSGLVEL